MRSDNEGVGAESEEGVDVSVIVPAYHAEATLEQCLSSILSQQFAGTYEVVLCVSADSSQELSLPPRDRRVTVMDHVPRLSAAEARNRAVARARGRTLVFTDATVIASPDWLSQLL